MVGKGLKRAVWYVAALLAVGFGMEWGFSYILSAHGAAFAVSAPLGESFASFFLARR